MNMEQLMNRLTDLDNRMCALETDRSPDALHNKMAFFGEIVETHTQKLAEHENRLNAMDGDGACAEVFSDQELRKWYEASGLFIGDVRGFIGTMLSRPATVEEANQFMIGKFGDAKLRSRAGKWFRTCAIKRNTERH